ncbi:hypothetical protein PENSPDRAFT_734811 [Peniophora sp. CONT]|nr:hypothetical protein PENSPDRAFT_734811 [Peniophora sp. CONT]
MADMSALVSNALGAGVAYWREAMDARLSLLPRANALMTESAFESAYDAEVAAVHAALNSLQAQRDVQRAGLRELLNARLDVTSSFPPEILSHVLFYLSQSFTHSSVFERRKHLSWISAANICRRWRAVAFGTGALWSKLHLEMPTEIWSTFLDRARSSLLTIQGNLDHTTSLQRQDVLLRVHRIEELDIRVSEMNHLDALMVDLDLADTATHLRTIKVHTNHGPMRSPALETFLARDASSPRHLTLHGVHFPWGCSIASVETLRLSDTALSHIPSRHTPHLEKVVHTLSSAINLNALVLSGDSIFTLPSSLQPIVLASTMMRKLENIVLKCSPRHASLLLQTLLLPPTSSIHLRLRITDRIMNLEELDRDLSIDTGRIASALGTLLSIPGAPHYSTMRIQPKSPYIHLKLDHSILPAATLSTIDAVNVQKSVDIRLPVAAPGRDTRDTMRARTFDFARAFPIDRVKHLVLFSGLFWSRSDVVRLLKQASLIETLTIQSDTHGEDASALLHNIISPSSCFSPVEPTDDVAPGILLPALKHLSLGGVKFKTNIRCNNKDMPLSKILLEALASRHQLGYELQGLHLVRCRHAEDYDLHQWSQYVTDTVSVD